MHARELVELAALIATHGPAIARADAPLACTGVEEYWVASKCRLDRWGRALRRAGEKPNSAATDGEASRPPGSAPDTGLDSAPDRTRHAPSSPPDADWPVLQGVIEEVLTGEILTRVWTAVLAAHDHTQGTNESEPVARSVLIAHLEARHRVLSLLVRGGRIGLQRAVRLNGLRRRCERWTDLLVGYLTGWDQRVVQFAVEPDRARDFAEDLCYRAQLAGGRHAWSLMVASMKGAFRESLAPSSPNGDLNARIAAAVLGCFPGDMFQTSGLFRSVWMTRLARVTDDAQVMVDRLLGGRESGSLGAADDDSAARLDDRLRRLGF